MTASQPARVRGSGRRRRPRRRGRCALRRPRCASSACSSRAWRPSTCRTAAWSPSPARTGSAGCTRMTTQHLSALPPRNSAESLVLSPKGHVEHALHVVDDGTSTWLTRRAGHGGRARRLAGVDALHAARRGRRPDRRVCRRSASRTTRSRPRESRSPGATRGRGWSATPTAYGPVEATPRTGWHWRELIVPRADLARAVGDRPLAGIWALEALRVAARRPRLGLRDRPPHHRPRGGLAAHRRAPAEGLLPRPGDGGPGAQPGRPPRRLVFLHLDGSGHTLPERGAAVVAGERPVGFVTTVARHYEDGPIALALVKRSTACRRTAAGRGASGRRRRSIVAA